MREGGSPGDWLSLGSHGASREKGLAHTDLGKGDNFPCAAHEDHGHIVGCYQQMSLERLR